LWFGLWRCGLIVCGLKISEIIFRIIKNLFKFGGDKTNFYYKKEELAKACILPKRKIYEKTAFTLVISYLEFYNTTIVCLELLFG